MPDTCRKYGPVLPLIERVIFTRLPLWAMNPVHHGGNRQHWPADTGYNRPGRKSGSFRRLLRSAAGPLSLCTAPSHSNTRGTTSDRTGCRQIAVTNRPVQGVNCKSGLPSRRFTTQNRAIWHHKMPCHDSIRCFLCSCYRSGNLLDGVQIIVHRSG